MNANQTGHKQNVVNLGVMIARVNTFGAGYNPSREDLTIAGLMQLKTKGDAVIDAVAQAEIIFKNKTSFRISVFESLDGVVTRAINALRISGALPQTIEQAETMVRELRGKRAPSAKSTDEELAAAKAKGEEKKQVKLHNETYDRKVENFGKFAGFLASVPEYKPNEADITIAALQARLAGLVAANDEYYTAEAALDAVRSERYKLFYADNTGLINVALAVKTYVKSAYGSTSTQYKEISSIAFTRYEA